MASGGDFDENIDGGQIFTHQDIFDLVNFDFTAQYIFDSGNAILQSGYNSVVETGLFFKFYQIGITNVQNRPDGLEDKQLFKLLDTSKHRNYNLNTSIYSLETGSTFTLTGLSCNGSIKTKEINSLLLTPYSAPNRDSNCYKHFDYYPYSTATDIIPSRDLLYVYNTSNPESIDIKNYYFAMRTGVTGANVLGISCSHTSGFYTDTGNYIRNIRAPIHRYIVTGGKPIKFVCLLHGVPLMITGGNNQFIGGGANEPSILTACSVFYDLATSLNYFSGYSRSPIYQFPQYARTSNINYYYGQPNIDRPFLLEEYSGNTALFCGLGSLQGKTADVSGYIRKICNNGIVDGPFLKGSGQNTTFLCYSNYGTGFLNTYLYMNSPPFFGGSYAPFDKTSDFYTGLGVNISISKPIAYAPIATMTGMNVGGFTSDGFHGLLFLDGTGELPVYTGLAGSVQGHWATNNGSTDAYKNGAKLCKISGYNWFIESHYESYAGDMVLATDSSSHSPFSEHIRPTVFDGTNYINVPVGFVGSMTEPGYGGIEKIRMFDAWFNGRTFIEAAYMGLNHLHYAIMGDPLTKWR